MPAGKESARVQVPREKLIWARDMIGKISRPRKGSVMTVTMRDGHLHFDYFRADLAVPATGNWPTKEVRISAAHFRRIPDAFLTADPLQVKLEDNGFWIGTWGTPLLP